MDQPLIRLPAKIPEPNFSLHVVFLFSYGLAASASPKRRQWRIGLIVFYSTVCEHLETRLSRPESRQQEGLWHSCIGFGQASAGAEWRCRWWRVARTGLERSQRSYTAPIVTGEALLSISAPCHANYMASVTFRTEDKSAALISHSRTVLSSSRKVRTVIGAPRHAIIQLVAS